MTDWLYKVDTRHLAEYRELHFLHLCVFCLHCDAPVSFSTPPPAWPLLQPSVCIPVGIPAEMATSINDVNLSHSCHLSQFRAFTHANVTRYTSALYWHHSQRVADCLPSCISAAFTICHQSHKHPSVQRFHCSIRVQYVSRAPLAFTNNQLLISRYPIVLMDSEQAMI